MVYFPTFESSGAVKPLASSYYVAASTGSTTVIEPAHKIQMYSSEYFWYCGLGGLLACGPTHLAVTPLDVVKTRMQVSKTLYKNSSDAFRTVWRKEGLRGLFTGAGATYIGYSLQGAGNYGLYEFFKWKYGQLLGPETAARHQTPMFLAAAATAEFLADIMLCPWEAVKVKTQTTFPPYASNAFLGMAKALKEVGVSGLYRGITPLWARQVPYTMVKFATFENTVVAIWHQLPGQKKDYSKLSQTGVSFVAGYIAGVFCALVSHPADVMFSKINNEKHVGENSSAAIKRIYGEIGFRGLWTGLGTRIIMVGSITGVQWLFYDSFKAYVGIPTSGGS